MAKSSMNFDAKELQIHNQARNSVQYKLLQHETNEFKTIPIDPNLLTFTEHKVNKKFLEALYHEPFTKKLSSEFKYNLIAFYTYEIIVTAIILYSVVSLYFANTFTKSVLIFHLVSISFLFMYSLLILALILNSDYYHLYNRKFLCSLCCLWYLYFIFGNQNILHKILNDSYSENHIHFSVAAVGMIYYYRLVTFDSFKHVVIPVVVILAIPLFIVFLTNENDITEDLSEYLLMAVVLVLQIIESQKISIRASQLFFRYYSEVLSQHLLEDDQGGSQIELISKTELIVDKCEKVIKEIDNARKTIIYKDIKERLKDSIYVLREIKKHLGKYGRSETINFANNSNIDIEDQEFINQNFLNVKRIPERNKERHGTLKDFIERRPHFSFSESMLKENVDALDSLGEDWNFDMLSMYEKLGRTVSLIGKHLYHKWCLKELIGVSQDIAFRFFEHIEINYQNNPYHNSSHAADVFNSLYFFMINSEIDKVITPIESIACLLAALGHDIGHPGLTNRYLIASKHTLAMRYNDNSVLENMHCSMLYTILNEPECNIFQSIPTDKWNNVRKLIIEMILHTDMSRHFELLGRFRTRSMSLNDLSIDNIEDRVFILSIGLKCADLGHSAKTFSLHEKWTVLVCEEFFNQGDIEKSNNMPVSMYCDRDTTDISKSQSGFLKNVCLPLYEAYANYLKAEKIERYCVQQLRENLNSWDEISREKITQAHLMSKEEFMLKPMTRKNSSKDKHDNSRT